MKYQRRLINMAILALFMCTLLIVNPNAYAEDVLVESKIINMSVKIDKNGNEYVRFIIKETKELNGLTYQADTAVMAFQTSVIAAKKLSEGDTLKAICSKNEYKGRLNYNIIQIL